jgi:cysteine desulfuration protein SufE
MDKISSNIIADFELLSNWEEKYRFIIELGQELESLSHNLRIDQNLIRGCQSKVWLVCKYDEKKLYFYGDSEALITKGIVSLIIKLYSGRAAKEILENNLEETLNTIGLSSHLSMQRANGLLMMIKSIKNYARNYE